MIPWFIDCSLRVFSIEFRFQSLSTILYISLFSEVLIEKLLKAIASKLLVLDIFHMRCKMKVLFLVHWRLWELFHCMVLLKSMRGNQQIYWKSEWPWMTLNDLFRLTQCYVSHGDLQLYLIHSFVNNQVCFDQTRLNVHQTEFHPDLVFKYWTFKVEFVHTKLKVMHYHL